MDKIKVNNQVVSMRKFIKQAKIRAMNRYAKEIKMLQNKKGNEKQMLKYKRKAERLLEKMKLLKKIHPDSVSKLALSKAKNWKEILQQKNASLQDQCFALLANYSAVQAEVEKFHVQNKELIPKIPSLILEWEVKAKDPNSKNKKKSKRISSDNSNNEKIGKKFNTKEVEKRHKSTSLENGIKEEVEDVIEDIVKSKNSNSLNKECDKKEIAVVKEELFDFPVEELIDSKKDEISKFAGAEMSDSEKDEMSDSEKDEMSDSKKDEMSDSKKEKMSDSEEGMSDSEKEEMSDSEKEELTDSEHERMSDSEKEEMSNSDKTELNSIFNVLGSKNNFKNSKSPKNEFFEPDINSRLLKLAQTSAKNIPPAKEQSPEPALSHKTDPFFITGDSVVEDVKPLKKGAFRERCFNKRSFQSHKFDFKEGNKFSNNRTPKFGSKSRNDFKEKEKINKPFKKFQNFKNDSSSPNHFNKNKNQRNSNFQKGAKSPAVKDDEPLHPSWQAKRKLKEAVKSGFSGKRIVFDD